MRALFFGMPAGTSGLVLLELLQIGSNVTGVVVPAELVPHLTTGDVNPIARLQPPVQPPARLELLSPDDGDDSVDTLGVAWAAGVPVLAVSDLPHPQTTALLAGLEADVACVSCFPRRIPPALLRLPRLGFLNLHPSLLPAYRGPSPLFWQLRDGAPTGVTIHYMDETFDTGPIAAQEAVALPDGISGPAATRLLTGVGVELLRGVLSDLAQGIVPQRPQPDGGHYQGQPQDEDFTLSTTWTARRAFNFMRGTADWGRPYALTVAGESLQLAEAFAYNELELGRPSVRHGRNILIRFNPGILYARLSG